MLDTTWHKAASVFIFGGPAFVAFAAVLGNTAAFVMAGLWVLVVVVTWIIEGREQKGGASHG